MSGYLSRARTTGPLPEDVDERRAEALLTEICATMEITWGGSWAWGVLLIMVTTGFHAGAAEDGIPANIYSALTDAGRHEFQRWGP
jgi:hypothetical protein